MSPAGNRQASVGISGAWLYDLYRNWGGMGEIAVSQARENLAEVIESTQRSGEPIVFKLRGFNTASMPDTAFIHLCHDAILTVSKGGCEVSV